MYTLIIIIAVVVVLVWYGIASSNSAEKMRQARFAEYQASNVKVQPKVVGGGMSASPIQSPKVTPKKPVMVVATKGGKKVPLSTVTKMVAKSKVPVKKTK